MPICSYLVIPRKGAAREVGERLRALPSCEVETARDHDLLILVTDTPGLDAENDLRARVESMDDVYALLLAFGEIDPACTVGDPVRSYRRAGRGRSDRRSGSVDDGSRRGGRTS